MKPPQSILPEAGIGFPPTIVVVHPKEKRSKCSVEPLRGQPGFQFVAFPDRPPQQLDDYIRLSLEGPTLSHADAHRGILLLDATWKLVERMEAKYRHVTPRRLGGWKTAYPRTSKLYDDPLNGLATVEALYAALVQMGRPAEAVLDGYRWKDAFLEKNAELIAAADKEFAVPLANDDDPPSATEHRFHTELDPE